MKLLIAIGLLAAAMSTASAQSTDDVPYGFARSQKPDIVKLKGEAQNAFNTISSDKHKIQTFCEMADLVINSTRLIGRTTPRKLRRSPTSWTNWSEIYLNILRWLAA